jgi:membrane protein implicated in regulation of membrane protease activity
VYYAQPVAWPETALRSGLREADILATVNSDDYAEFEPRLRPGERLLWVGHPDTRVLFAPADVYLVPFSVVWCFVLGVILAQFLSQNTRQEGELAYQVIIWLAALVGLYLLIGRFIYKRVRNASTRYAVTTQRAIALIGSRTSLEVPITGRSTAMRPTRNGKHITVTWAAEAGTATSGALRQQGTAPNTGTDWMSRGRPAPFAFYDVEHPDELREAIETAEHAA